MTEKDSWDSFTVDPTGAMNGSPVVEVEIAVTTNAGMDGTPEENSGNELAAVCNPEYEKVIFVRSVPDVLNGCKCGPRPPENMVVTIEGAWETRPVGLVEQSC